MDKLDERFANKREFLTLSDTVNSFNFSKGKQA